MKTEQDTLCDPEEVARSQPEGACVNYAECGNLPPGHPETRNQMCDACLDAIRAAGDGRGD